MTALARNDDPASSHEAAAVAKIRLGELHARILEALWEPATASELMKLTNTHYNTLWRRLSELKKLRYVRNTKGKRKNSRGFNETIVERV